MAARYWFCAEECRLRAVEGIRYVPVKATQDGLRGHKWLEERPKSKSWLNVQNQIKDVAKNSDLVWFDYIGMAAKRQYKGTWVIAHPDDYDVIWNKRQIRFIENKTIKNPDWKRYLGPVANQQLEISIWVWEPVLDNIGWHLADDHYVYWWDRNDMWPLGPTHVTYTAKKVEDFLDRLFGIFEGTRNLIPPSDFKCRTCRTFKDHCTIINREPAT